MNPKIKKLISLLAQHRLDAFLVTKDINIRYLTDFPASESWLLVCAKRVFYIADFRYILEAKKGLGGGIAVTDYQKSIFDTAIQTALSQKVARLGFDERHISLFSAGRLKKSAAGKVQLKAANSLVESLREIKTPEEISKIRQALRLNLKAYDFLRKVVRPGLSEKEVFRRLESFVKAHGAGFSFPPIIASGPNSCFPHAKVTDRKIKNNESVLIDMGMDIGGYKSDLTRNFFLGKIPHLLENIYAQVDTAQKKAIRKIRPGVPAGEIDRQARGFLAENRLGKFFGHSLGHGVGLEVHEGPTISSGSQAVLKEGMVFTVEPAVYLPNKFGVRIEDMVLVTRSGCEVLSDHFD